MRPTDKCDAGGQDAAVHALAGPTTGYGMKTRVSLVLFGVYISRACLAGVTLVFDTDASSEAKGTKKKEAKEENSMPHFVRHQLCMAW